MITIKVMYSIYSRMYKHKIESTKKELQGLYASHREVVKTLLPYSSILEENGITIDDMNNGIFKELPNTFTTESRVLNILYTNAKISYNPIHYKLKDYNKHIKDFLPKETFYKVVKISLKMICKAMIEEKYSFKDYRIGEFKIVHRYLKNAIKWKESEENKERLKKEGKFTKDCKWVISGETTYLIPEWIREGTMKSKALKDFEYKVPKSDYGIIGMIAEKSKTLSMMGILDYPPYREANLIKLKN